MPSTGMIGSGEVLQANLAMRQARLAAQDALRRPDEGRRQLAALIGLPARALEETARPFDDLGEAALPTQSEVAAAAEHALQIRPDVLINDRSAMP